MGQVICIDGPAASGKSTVSRAVAKKLGILYVDSGALYRIMTWQALEHGVDCSDAAAVAAFCETVNVVFEVRGERVAYLIDGEEPGDRIRTPEINAHVSPVSAVPAVRARVTAWLREMPQLGDLIVEGRDIGSVVYPDSPYRIYLDCDADERSRRRLAEDIGKGFEVNQEQVKASLLNRDRIDSSRSTAPLKKADGALVIDTTNLTIEQVVDAIAKVFRP